MRRRMRATALVVLLATGCRGDASLNGGNETLYSESPPVWFEAHTILANIAPNGRSAAMRLRWPVSVRTIDLERGSEAATSVATIVDSARFAVFRSNSEPVVRGWRFAEFGWFTQGRDSVERLPIPPNAFPRWSADGSKVAYFEPDARVGEPEHALFAGPIDAPRKYPLAGRITGLSWLPGDSALLVMAADSLGGSTLWELSVATGLTFVRVPDLDADPGFSPIAVTPDGRRAFLALSSPGALRPEERHRPNADRDLDIYEIDLATGVKRPVVATPAEEGGPAIANGHLYWTHTAIDMSIIVLPIEGGVPSTVAPGGFLPSWRPDGKAIGFAYGGFFAADWVLNWEGGFVELDSAARAASSPQPLITGFHEDFGPIWSPNGKWIAYHSHRSSGPVPLYASPGATDDIYVRRAGSTDEIRLTNYGWEVGSPDWSRDGRQLLFTGWHRPEHAEGRGTYAGIVTIDTIAGRALNHRSIPLGPIPSAEMASWSPGSDLVAIEGAVRPGLHALWIVKPDGSTPRKLIEYASHTYGGLDWTLDGTTIIYSGIVDGRPQLFAIPVNSGAPRQLTREDASILHPQVSPDGRHIAATRIVQSKEIRRMRIR